MENRFNLVDEPWIPVADHGRVSLRQLFTRPDYRSLGGNPVQKIALMKLLLAIAQAASTPRDETEWRALGAEGLAQRCMAYLQQWHDRFYLYGEKPFLQMPAVETLIEERTKTRLVASKTKAKIMAAKSSGHPKSMGAGFYPDLPSKNNTLLSHTLFEKEMSDADKALFVVTLMNFAFAGKRVEADMLSLGSVEMGNRYSASAGPSLGGFIGQLHCFPIISALLGDLWVNLLTHENIRGLNRWPQGLGSPPWETMPRHETDLVALKHKESYQGSLVAMCRFVLLKDTGIYYLDGIKYPGVKDGWFEPSLAINSSGTDMKVKYVDPEKRPWRELQSLLSFVEKDASSGFECFALKNGAERIRTHCQEFAVWAGGLRVSSNSGDQSVKQRDDFVESLIWLHSDCLGELWYSQLNVEMKELNSLSENLKTKVKSYFKELTSWQKGHKESRLVKEMPEAATSLFWQLCERNFQELVDACYQDEPSLLQRQQLRRRFAGYVQQAYERYCPKDTARQLDAWARYRPNNSQYLQKEA